MADFIQDYIDMYRDYCSGVLQYRRKIWLDSKYKEKCVFIVKEQDRNPWIENY